MIAGMIARLTITLLVFAAAAGVGGVQTPEESETAKKERMFQQYLEKVRRAMPELRTNVPAELRDNSGNSTVPEKMARDIFDANWIHSSFGLYWDEIPPPTIRGSNATVEVDRFIAENGWHMLTNDWLFLITIDERGKPIHGLPWEVIRGRTFKAATHDGILYFPLRRYMPMGSSGLAYNPQTNRFNLAADFKPIGDHWYVWSQTDTPSNKRSFYEGETPGSAKRKRIALTD
jgi:hypothetical protein